MGHLLNFSDKFAIFTREPNIKRKLDKKKMKRIRRTKKKSRQINRNK